MTNTINILKESFITYIQNIKKISLMTLPIFLIYIYNDKVLNLFSKFAKNNDIIYLLSGVIISISILLLMLFIALFLKPALFRSIQIHEDHKRFETRGSYRFQYNNLLKYLILKFWFYVNILYVLLPYIVVNIGYVLLLVKMKFQLSLNVTTLNIFEFLGFSTMSTILILNIVTSLLPLIIGILINIPKFLLATNVFFSKEHNNPRKAVKDSIALGKTKTKQLWGIVFILFILNIFYFMIYNVLVSFDSLAFVNMYILLPGLNMFVLIPFVYIILAKGYNSVKEIEEVEEVVMG